MFQRAASIDMNTSIISFQVTGITALMWVVGYGLLNMTQFLIDRGSNKDTTDVCLKVSLRSNQIILNWSNLPIGR